MTENCRAALWYSKEVSITNTKIHGIKALQECSRVAMQGCNMISPEFGWSVHDIEITDALESTFGGDVHVHENTWPGLFGIIAAMWALVVFMYVITAVFILIVTGMTGGRVLAAEQRDIAIYKAIGFTDAQQRLSFALRFGVTGAAGAVVGIVLSAFLTDPLVSTAMKMAGISNFASVPAWNSTLFPLLTITVLFGVFAFLAAGKIKRVSLTVLITE